MQPLVVVPVDPPEGGEFDVVDGAPRPRWCWSVDEFGLGVDVDGLGEGVIEGLFDNAAAEAFFSSLEWEVLSRHEFAITGQAQAVVLDWCYGFYNHDRRHSTIGMMSPINYENTATPDREVA